MARDRKQVLLTGVTGFVGKVVLETLMRRREVLGIERVHVLIRPGRERDPQRRFEQEVVRSACFDALPREWVNRVRVVPGELTQDDLGIDGPSAAKLCDRLTHVIHCAATVEFDLPLAEAAAANISGSLNVLALARRCSNLAALVACSTSYVSPFAGESVPVREALVDLPFCAEAAYRDILEGRADPEALLARSGLPNTYTLSKCISERLMAAQQGSVPLVIVRPSIVSASLRHPMPGWIDSSAAFAGFVMLIGAGYLRTVVGAPDTRLDIIPCDEVADRLVAAAFGPSPDPKDGPRILHAVAGTEHSCTVGECAAGIVEFFQRHPVARHPRVRYVGPGNKRFARKEWQHQTLPAALARTWFGVSGQPRKASQVTRLTSKLGYLNRAFPYFTHHTFEFQTSVPLAAAFSAGDYQRLVCRGVFRHLMRGDESQMLVAGKRHQDGRGDLRWAVGQPHGNLAIRLGSYVVRKAFRRIARRVTFDKPSFERARDSLENGELMVIIPSHRSYLDFLVCSFLFFSRPDLGVAIPHIAATDDFARIPLLGWLFGKMRAFYIRRGVGREDPQLTQQVRALAAGGQTLQFFIEGTRSRSRQFLAPKRGLLRALQGTGQRCVVLPLAISYDRVPEQRAFIQELTGGPRPKMTLRGLLRWSLQMILGRVELGRIHVTCGQPQTLTPDSCVHRFSREVVGQLQACTVTTSHHLDCFVRGNPLEGIHVDWMREAIARRGGQVLESRLRSDQTHPVTERCMRYQWAHLFYGEALAAFPDHPAITHHITRNGFHQAPFEPELWDPAIRRLLRALFEPVCQDYQAVARAVGRPGTPLDPELGPRSLVARIGGHLPVIQAAFSDLVEREILVVEDTGGYAWGPRAAEIAAYRARCAWPVERPGAEVGEPSAGYR